eukprot:2338921-Prymnesium_polylepis.1
MSACVRQLAHSPSRSPRSRPAIRARRPPTPTAARRAGTARRRAARSRRPACSHAAPSPLARCSSRR